LAESHRLILLETLAIETPSPGKQAATAFPQAMSRNANFYIPESIAFSKEHVQPGADLFLPSNFSSFTPKTCRPPTLAH
jgi:hypothetical protein